MKVDWKRSLSTKLFVLMSVSLLFTVGTTVLQNRNMFKDFLERQLEDNTVRQAQDTSVSIDSTLENWISTTSVAMSNIPNMNSRSFKNFLNNFLVANPEFISFDVYSTKNTEISPITNAFTENIEDIRFEDSDITSLKNHLGKENLKWLKEILEEKNVRSKYLRNHNRVLEAPITSIAIRYAVQNKSSYNWAIVSIWQTRLIKSLHHSEIQTTFIVENDKQGNKQVSLSPQTPKEWSTLFDTSKPITSISLTESPFGYRAFNSPDGKELIGAYQNLEQYGLSVININDAKSAYIVINNILLKSVLWSIAYLILFVGLSYFASRTVTSSLEKLTNATQIIASGEFDIKLNQKSKDEVGLLSRSINNMSQQISALLISQVEKARQEKELETAKLIQETLFPKGNLIQSKLLRIAAKNTAASECGGDWWYHHTTSDGREIVIIADATGHGAPAALVTAMAFSGYQMLIKNIKEQSEDLDPLKLLANLNSVFYKAGNGTSTMTGLICIFDPHTSLLTIANAGHNLPFIIPKSADDERLVPNYSRKKKKRMIKMQAGGTPIGVMEKWDGEVQTCRILPGDKVIMYTDGIFECSNPEGEQWGSKRFRQNLDKNAHTDAEEFIKLLFHESTKFFAGNPADDDITVVVAEISDSWRSLNKIA